VVSKYAQFTGARGFVTARGAVRRELLRPSEQKSSTPLRHKFDAAACFPLIGIE
jgi:hypothetical protein